MLSRPQFDVACKAYIVAHPQTWSWNEHPTWPGFGYMSRSTVQIKRTPQEEVLEDIVDEATAPTDMIPVICQQYVVYSATFQVPTFYFTMHSSQGEPLSLDDILCTSLLRVSSFRGAENSGFALTHPTIPFPLLSQGEHPTLGTPCWYLHPCETTKAVEELLGEKESGWNEIEAWLLIVGNVVELGNT